MELLRAEQTRSAALEDQLLAERQERELQLAGTKSIVELLTAVVARLAQVEQTLAAQGAGLDLLQRQVVASRVRRPVRDEVTGEILYVVDEIMDDEPEEM